MSTATCFPYTSEADRQKILERYDELLSHWPVPLKTYFAGPDKDTHILEWGSPDRMPLVLIHGSTSNSISWMGDAAAYGATHHVFALDIPGDCGRSSPVRPPLTGEAYAQWLLRTLNDIPAVATRPIRLIGLSLGGWVSLQFAVRHPERVEKLGLLAPAGVGPQRASLLARILLYSLFGEKGTRRLLRDISGDETNMPKEAITFSLMLSKVFRPIMEPIPLLTDEELRRLNMPVRLLAGGRDVMMASRKSVSRLASLVPHAACVLLPGAPHALINKAADMNAFLERT